MPSPANIRGVSQELSRAGYAIANELADFAFPKAAPGLQVTNRKFSTPEFDLDFMYGFSEDLDQGPRAPHTAYPSDDSELSWTDRLCYDDGKREKLDDLEVGDATAVNLPLVKLKAGRAMMRQMIAHERRIALLYDTVSGLDANGYETIAAAADKWDTDTADIPAKVISGIARLKVFGRRPGQCRVFAPTEVLLRMANAPSVLDKYKHTQMGRQDVLSAAEFVRQIWGFREVVECGASRNTNQRNEDASLSGIWPEGFYIAAHPQSPALENPGAVYCAVNVGGANGEPVSSQLMPNTETSRGSLLHAYHVVKPFISCKYLIYSIRTVLT